MKLSAVAPSVINVQIRETIDKATKGSRNCQFSRESDQTPEAVLDYIINHAADDQRLLIGHGDR